MMSSMEMFYANLVSVGGLGGKATMTTAVPLSPATVSPQDSGYQELLVQLTRVTLDDLTSLKSVLAWQSWWDSADKS